jgi:hypothetical protein
MTTKNIHQKLASAKKSFPTIVKDVKGFGYKYADLAQIIEAISQPLWNNGLDFMQTIQNNHITTFLIDLDSGENICLADFEIISAAISKATEIQQFGGGITYLRRYSLLLGFSLATEDDNGANTGNIVKTPSAEPHVSITIEKIKQLYDIKKSQVEPGYIEYIEEAIAGTGKRDIVKLHAYLSAL